MSHSSRPLRRSAVIAAAAAALTVVPLGGVADAAPATNSPSASAAPAAAAHRLHVVRTEHLEGTSGHLDYDVTIPVFAGTRAAAAVNARVRTSADQVIVGTAAEPGDHHTLDGRAHVTTNDGRTVQVATEYADYFDGAAHPTDTVETVALVAATGAPIRLSAVFAHLHAALKELGPVVKRIAAAHHEPVSEASGLAPATANWAAWQTTRKGFEVHFQDYQLGGHGLHVYTVPWRDVPRLTARAKALLAPTR